MHFALPLLLTYVSSAMAICPMGELARRGLAPAEMQEAYNEGRGLGTPGQKRQDESSPPGKDGPPLLDPISGIVSPIGLGGLLPRSETQKREWEQHIRSRLEERDEDVNVDAPILTPKAQKRHFEERGLIGGLLAPLSGVLQAIDVPTPQESGLKAIPGDDPAHQYQAPGPGDVRGNCPTLNTIANHGYISRTGVTSFAEAANAIQTAYSMSFDIAIFLSAFGLLAGGDLVTGKYTIGGQDDRVPNTLGPAYGIDRHGVFELDSSISRGDRFFGDSHSLNMTRWNKLVSDANTYGDGLFNIEAMKHNAADAVDESRATNPEFSFGGNFIVTYATRALLTRPLPNGTDPEVADYKNIAPFYLNETFPEGWLRIPNSYSLVDLLADVGDLFLFKPQPLGRNYEGRFVPFGLTLPTAPGDVGCFAASLLASVIPSQLSPELEAVNAVKDQILGAVFKSAKCDISTFGEDAGSNNNSQPGGTLNDLPQQSGDAGSGSGVTRLGQYDSQSTAPTGKSAGQAASRSSTKRALMFGSDRI